MNWPEHLLLLHRLSGHQHFRFGFAGGELRVHLADNPYFRFWLPDEPEGCRLKSDTELVKALARFRNVFLMEAS